KSEVFNFSRIPGDDNPSIDLGFAPFTSSSPLKPQEFWRYLGFYFDRKLTFNKHICYWSTKALSSVHAMKMLGNSTCRLLPHQKQLLYRSCIVPLTIYGCRLWYFSGAKIVSKLKLL
ncbi:hypothetical protein AN958_11580, partial [Leucoagaricus sp. SymC.cos]